MDIDKTLELHKKWLENDDKGVRADLHGADLHGADLWGADLQGADLHGADLHGADLQGADLQGADLYGADLRNADLGGADLQGADLGGADLHGAHLNWVNWHECLGIEVYVAGLQSSRPNAQLVYIPKLDVATTGCWQDTWEDTKQRVAEVYKDYNKNIYEKYQLAFDYIEAQVKMDKDVEDE